MNAMTNALTTGPRRVLLLGGTGTIGRATAVALQARGHEVVCFARTANGLPPGVAARVGVLTDAASWQRDALRGERFDVMVSCLASRTGSPSEARAIDLEAHRLALAAAVQAQVRQFVLLSALCVQKPRLAFQHAKLAFEAELRAADLDWTIVRPTAYFKSLAGQVERVRRGQPFLVFGNGRLTACRPISDRDLAEYLADCIDDPARRRRVLPIGGPGPALTPHEMGEQLHALLGRPARFRRVPVRLLDVIIGLLNVGAKFHPALVDKAEFARIGRYYATESMLVLDPATARYDAAATPATGHDTLHDYYARLIAGSERAERGAHAVFD